MTVATDFVKITPKASEEVIKLVKAENNPEIGLRLLKVGVAQGYLMICNLPRKRKVIRLFNMKALMSTWMPKV